MNTINQHTRKSRTMTFLAGIIGNILEWYDFAIYGFFAPILGGLFFPSEDPTVSLIASFGAFAAGFLMRPVGGAIFGHIGDRISRKRALNISVLLMAVPTFIIGILPTHDSIIHLNISSLVSEFLPFSNSGEFLIEENSITTKVDVKDGHG